MWSRFIRKDKGPKLGQPQLLLPTFHLQQGLLQMHHRHGRQEKSTTYILLLSIKASSKPMTLESFFTDIKKAS